MGYIKNTVIAAASAATIAIGVIACGGEATPPTPTLPSPATATPAPTTPPTPTLARLTLPELQTATPTPTPTPATATADRPATANMRATPNAGDANLLEADLVPDNPQTNDNILLQDIYQRLGMDYLVSTYALHETYEVDRRTENEQVAYLTELPATSHPYRHIMPAELDHWTGIAHAERFLSQPYFEPNAPGYGPWNFGQHGIRAALLDAVTAGAERIAQDAGIAVQPPALDAQPDRAGYEYAGWTTRQRLATTPAEITVASAQPDQGVDLLRPVPDPVHPCGYTAEAQWTRVSDHLPIFRVDVRHNICVYGNKPGQATEEHPIQFTASAVIAFQHRHTSFTDPERRADYAYEQIADRRGPDAEAFLASIQTVPYTEPQWRPADYMHYAIIGPVIITPRGGEPFAVSTGNPSWPAQPGTPPDGIRRNAWLFVNDNSELACRKITLADNQINSRQDYRQTEPFPDTLCPETLHQPAAVYPNYHYPFPGELTRAQPTINLDDEAIAYQWERLNRELAKQGIATDQPTQHANGDW